MTTRPARRMLRLLVGASLALQLSATAAPPVPDAELTKLRSALTSHQEANSEARKRLALKRLTRDAATVLEDHPEAPNRFEVLDLVFEAQKALCALDDSPRQREALLETARELARAPDEAAEARLDADLLLSQTEVARQGASAEARIKALRPMLARYQGTPAETRMIRIALVMALELGDNEFIGELRETIALRFPGDLELITFLRDKLGGQIFGAPFCGTFQRDDGTQSFFPADAQGQSTGIYFWSRKDSLEDLQNFATVWKEQRDEVAGRLQIISLNVDELPDAGEKILRDHGLDWPALHLPGGRESLHFKAFARQTPAIVTLSPTGYAAFHMAGATRKSSGTTSETRDYTRWIQSSLARSWTHPRYLNHTASILAGDFLIVDPSAPFDPALPPEGKTHLPITGTSSPLLERSDLSIPEDTLLSLQKFFVPPPFRYRLTIAEIKKNYLDAVEYGASVLAVHPEAPDRWLVQNRMMIAGLGLWKLNGEPAHLQEAVTLASQVLAQNLPVGGGLVARFCLARQALRQPGVDARDLITRFVEEQSTGLNKGPVLAAAAVLALDAGDRERHEHLRTLILQDHLDHPMMWTFANFLLDRFHRYELFRAPFVSGRSFGWRQDYFLAFGAPEEARRVPDLVLPGLDGQPVSVVPSSTAQWTVLLVHGQAVTDKRAPLFRDLDGLLNYAGQRPLKDLRVVVALTMGNDDATRSYLAENPLDCPTLTLPGGSQHPLLNQLGLVSEDETSNLVLLRPDGSVFRVVSGLALQTKARDRIIRNAVEWHDEQTILRHLEEGRVDEAKELIFALAPPVGDQTKPPTVSLAHLRSRARVHLALGQLDAALNDAKDAVKQKTFDDAGMSMRTEELNETEALLRRIEQESGK